MAIFHASMKSLSRSDGRSAVAASAYRAGVRLTDERTGLVHDFSRRSGVVSEEILTPDGGPADRAQLWNAAELAERRKDSRTGREWVLALPEELDAEQRRELARGFALELVRRYGVAVDMAIHEPSKGGDERNHHAHVFTTTRSISRDESGALVMGEKAAIELSDSKRKKLDAGLKSAAEEVTELRQLWERLANEALERAGRAERITAKSFEAQGIDREPTTHLGPSATAMERRGEASERGETNRQAEARNAEREAVQAEIIDLQAEKARRAKEAQERREREEAEAKAKEVARQEAARCEEARQERERMEGMTVEQLKTEILFARPRPVASLVDHDKAVTAAQSRQKEAEERQSLAAQEAQAWREQHRFLTWLHDRRFLRSAELEGRERSREETQRAADDTTRSVEAIRRETAERITEAQKPAQERLKALEEVLERKEREEALEARRAAQARKLVEESARAQEEAQRAAREAAEREAARKEEAQAEERRRSAVEKGGETFREEVRRDPEAMRVHLLKSYLPQKMTHRQRETWGERMREIAEIEQAPEAPKEANRIAQAKEPEPWRDLSPSSPPPKPKSRDRRGWDRDR